MKKYWKDEAIELVQRSARGDLKNKHNAEDVVTMICEILEKHGYLDSDWWSEEPS